MQHDEMVRRLQDLLSETDEVRNDDDAYPSSRQLALVVRDFLLLFRDQVIPAPAGGQPWVGPAVATTGPPPLMTYVCADCGCCVGTCQNFWSEWLCSECADHGQCPRQTLGIDPYVDQVMYKLRPLIQVVLHDATVHAVTKNREGKDTDG